MRSLAAITTAVIHHSASTNATVEQIDEWHRAEGFRRLSVARLRAQPALESIGYHRVILRSGVIVEGRALDEVGAHAKGANGDGRVGGLEDSVGICLVGNGKFSLPQWRALAVELSRLQRDLGALTIVGHRNVGTTRTECPGFDVAAWLSDGCRPPKASVLP